MTYLEQLLEGKEVEWRPLGEVFEIRTGYTPSKANKEEYWNNGTIPWFRMEDLRAQGGVLTDSIQHITPQAVKGKRLFKAGSIILSTTATIGEHALLLVDALTNQRFTNFNLRTEFADRVLSKFLYYYFFEIAAWCKNHVFIGTFPSVDMRNLRLQKFPLPPLAVQEQIVEILDKFTALIEALETELTLRTRQYAYYRNKLLRFGTTDPNVQWCRLGEVAELKRGVRVVRKQLEKEGQYPVYQNCLTPLGYFDKANCKAETAFVIMGGSAGKVGFSKVDFWAADDCLYFITPEYLLSRYLYYFLCKKETYLDSQVRRAAVPRLARSVLADLLIPLPPLAVQEQIVAILDKFDTLVHSMSEGLPAEIALRRRQYEYYRNLLLRFPPPPSAPHSH